MSFLKKGGRFSRKKNSLYFTSLFEKQKMKLSYIISERQSLIVFRKAKILGNDTGLTFIKLLEMRLDSLLFRTGSFITKLQIRQLINHRFVKVNGSIITSPSFECKLGDSISFPLSDLLRKDSVCCPWLSALEYNLVKVIRFPNNKELESLNFNLQVIVEFYNKFI